MSIVWHTNLELISGRVYDTLKWAHLNEEALDKAPGAVREVEDLLEEVRLDQFPGLPRRVDSILAVPWPDRPVGSRDKGKGYRKIFDPPGTASFCYYLSLLPETNHRLLDEKYVMELVRIWPSMGGSHERWSIAAEYWDGGILESYSLLIEGIFTVERPCSGGSVPLYERVERGYSHRGEGIVVLRPLGRQARRKESLEGVRVR